jgi:acyl carrier protein
MSPAAFLQKPLLWLELISRYRASISGGPNFAYDLCVRKITAEQKEGLDLSAWKVAFNGSESIWAETLSGFASAFASCGFRAESFYPCYGLAEATLFVAGKEGTSLPTIRSIEARGSDKNRLADGPAASEQTRGLVGCGRPAGGHEIAIINPETLTERAEGEIGEIWISGPSVAKGYWNRPEETRQTFQVYLNGVERGPYLRSGDLGAIDDGELFITGRCKDLIIIRGVNHYPEDIEQTISQCHPALRPHACAAFSIEDNGEEKLVIVQELSRSYRGDTSQIINLIRSRISEKHLLQVFSIALIRQGSIPKTSSGKIQRHACKTIYQKGALKLVTKWHSGEQEKPDSPTFRSDDPNSSEGRVRLWLQELLATKLTLAKSELSITQPLITYGLDSLTTLELSHAVEVNFGVSITVADLLQGVTLAQLAERIENSAKIKQPSIVSVQDDTYYPLTPGQEALLFLSNLHPDNTSYNLMGAARIVGEIDQPAIRDSFQKIVDRHECLRTTFTNVEGRSVQFTRPYQEIYFLFVDASGWDEDLLRAKIEDASHELFDLEEGPLFRVTLFSKSAEDHILLLSIHHIIADFWSLAIIVREFGILYKARNEKNVKDLAQRIRR